MTKTIIILSILVLLRPTYYVSLVGKIQEKIYFSQYTFKLPFYCFADKLLHKQEEAEFTRKAIPWLSLLDFVQSTEAKWWVCSHGYTLHTE